MRVRALLPRLSRRLANPRLFGASPVAHSSHHVSELKLTHPNYEIEEKPINEDFISLPTTVYRFGGNPGAIASILSELGPEVLKTFDSYFFFSFCLIIFSSLIIC